MGSPPFAQGIRRTFLRQEGLPSGLLTLIPLDAHIRRLNVDFLQYDGFITCREKTGPVCRLGTAQYADPFHFFEVAPCNQPAPLPLATLRNGSECG